MRPSSVGQSLQTPGDIRAAPGDTSGPPGSPSGKKDGAIPYTITRDQQILKRAGKQRGGVRRRPGSQEAWTPREREAPRTPGTPPLSARPSLRFLRVWRPWSPLLPRPSPSPDPPGENGVLAGVAVRLPGESGVVKPFLVGHIALGFILFYPPYLRRKRFWDLDQPAAVLAAAGPCLSLAGARGGCLRIPPPSCGPAAPGSCLPPLRSSGSSREAGPGSG